jgi:PUA domain protein
MSEKIRNRHRLKKKEIKGILNELKTKFSSDFFNIDSSVEVGYLDQFKVILVDEEIDFMMIEDKVVFTLFGLYKYNPKEHFVVIDMGAVSFVSKGADIMTPGIIDADINIQKSDYVWICDQKHRKPLAVGMALMTGEEMKSKNTGKAIKNIHYVGDKLWNLSNQIT